MLNSNKKNKIALMGDSLSKGGAEKVHAILSIYFERQGFEVHNCIFIDAVTYKYSGSLLNLGEIKPDSSSIIRKIYRFRALQKWVNTNDFDCLIDFRMRPSFIFEFILSKLIYPHNTIYYVLSGRINFYFPKNNFLSQLLYKNRKVATVSEAIATEILNKKYSTNVRNVYQPFDFIAIENQKNEFSFDYNYILAVGNMDNNIKQIDKLIRVYSKSELPKQNIKLVILGEGKYKIMYQKLVGELKLDNLVMFKGTVQNPFPYYKNAFFYVLSSKNEGLSNAIIESLACETPVIAFDCFSGPGEIISNNQNGILVEDQNFDKLIEAINSMASDAGLYARCKQNSLKSVEKFSVGIIGRQWEEFIKS